MDVLNLFFLFTIWTLRIALCQDYEDEREIKPSWNRCSYAWGSFKNGRAKIRARGRLTKFVCNSGFELVGKRFATCVRGQWNHPSPVCIARGCYSLPEPANGRVKESYRGAYLVYDCMPGYSLKGPESIYCDGYHWSDDVPTCEAPTNQPEMSCDFEDPDFCGWLNDPMDDFNWLRHNLETPSYHVGTGPSHDHTYGKGKAGFYMYEEASAPRKENDVARLFSPVFPRQSSSGCFVFWYHMYGSGMGKLRVYVKSESYIFGELFPSWEVSGDFGNEWHQGNVTIPLFNENFQIVIEGFRGPSYLSDMAIDDVSVLDMDCSSVDSVTSTVEASNISCRGRCRETDPAEICGCSDSCVSNNFCCEDYFKICTTGEEANYTNEVEGVDEIPPTRQVRTTTELPLVEQPEQQTTVSTDEPHWHPTAGPIITTTQKITTYKPRTTTLKPTTVSTITTTRAPTSTSVATRSTEKTTNPTSISTSKKYVTLSSSTSTRMTPTPRSTTPSTPNTPKTTTVTTTTTTTPSTTTTTTTTRTTTVQATKATKQTTSLPVRPKSTQSATRPTVTTPQPLLSTRQPTSSVSTSTQSPSYTTKIFTVLTTSRSTVLATMTSRPTYRTLPTENATQTTDTLTYESRSTTVAVTPKTTTATTPKTSSTTKSTTTSTTAASPTTKPSTTPFTTSKSTTRPYSPTTRSTTTTTARVYSPRPFFRTTTTTLRPSIATEYSQRTMFTTTTPRYNLRPRSTTPTTTTMPRTSSITRSTKDAPTVMSTTSTARPTYPSTSITEVLATTDKDILSSKEKSIQKVSGSTTPVAGISIAVLLVVALAGGVIYYFFRRKKLLQKNLSEDSEIRFLSDNEVVEFSDASALDRIRFK